MNHGEAEIEDVGQRMQSAFYARAARVQAMEEGRRMRHLFRLLMAAMIGLVLCSTCLGAASELPPANGNSPGWLKILSSGSPQAILSVVVGALCAAVCYLIRRLFKTWDAWRDSDAERNTRLQDVLVKNSEANSKLAMSIEQLEQAERELTKAVSTCPRK
jgi:hypothetical protein